MRTIDRNRVTRLLELEDERYVESHPKSQELFARASHSLLNGLPMNWMEKWPSPYPPFMQRAVGGRLWDADGNEYIDFCLGDTGAMAGHSPLGAIDAITHQAANGLTAILPTEDAIWVGEELTRRFGVGIWQVAMTATDANRFAMRLARHITGRNKILVFNWCYHGTVDEALAILDGEHVVRRPGVVGSTCDPSHTTRVVEFNDVAALARELSHGDVACVLCEPALTNIGIILPEPNFHHQLRRLTREAGTLLVIDETHTLCAGPGGMTGAEHLSPDLLVVGKSIGGGFPVAALGMTHEVATAASEPVREPHLNISGIGGTLSGNALAIAAVRGNLETSLRDEDYAYTVPLAARWADGVAAVIADADLAWTVTQLGCRAEYWLSDPRTARQAADTVDDDVERFLHLYALNRGLLLTPFHNMALMCTSITGADVDTHTEVFEAAVSALTS